MLNKHTVIIELSTYGDHTPEELHARGLKLLEQIRENDLAIDLGFFVAAVKVRVNDT